MNSKSVMKALEMCQSDCGRYIDMDKLRELMRVIKSTESTTEPTLFARIDYRPSEDDEVRFVVTFKAGLTAKQENTLYALLLAKLILNPDKVKTTGAEVDAFEFKGLRQIRYSRLMYLATRLALPEEEIDNINTDTLRTAPVDATQHFTDELVYAAVSGHSVELLLGKVI